MDSNITPGLVRKAIKKWRKVLGIDVKYKVYFSLHQKCSTIEESANEGVEAVINVTDYYTAYMDICTFCVKKDNLNEVIIHELLHILLAEYDMLTSGKKSMERLATRLQEQAIEKLTAAILKGKK